MWKQDQISQSLNQNKENGTSHFHLVAVFKEPRVLFTGLVEIPTKVAKFTKITLNSKGLSFFLSIGIHNKVI